MKEIKVMLDKGAIMPTRAHEDDAGLDLYTPEAFGLGFVNEGNVNRVIHGVDSYIVDTGVHVEIPKGYVGMLKSKSGLNVKYGIISEGVIDAGYTGSIKVKLYSLDGEITRFKRGDKISQLVIMPIVTPAPKLVEKFAETERGNNGFGSTGR